MGKGVLIFFITTIILIWSPQSHAVVLYPRADAPTSSGSPDTNYNNHSGDLDAELWTGTLDGSDTRSYLQFNLSGLSTIHFATLYLYNGVSSGGRSSFAPATVDVYSTSSSWTEKGITWNNQPSLDVLGASTTVGTATGWYAWNITSLAKTYANGVLSLGLSSSGAGHVYYGREAAYEYMPYVEATMPEPATIISFSSLFLVLLPGIRKKILR